LASRPPANDWQQAGQDRSTAPQPKCKLRHYPATRLLEKGDHDVLMLRRLACAPSQNRTHTIAGPEKLYVEAMEAEEDS
jgi:hypothetical protein